MGAVSFERPWVVEISIIILFLYWFYRLKVVSNNPWRRFKIEVFKSLISDPKFIKIANEAAISYSKEIAENEPGMVQFIPAHGVTGSWEIESDKPIIARRFTVAIPIKIEFEKSGKLLHQSSAYLDGSIFWLNFWRKGFGTDFPFTILLPWILAIFAATLILISVTHFLLYKALNFFEIFF